ncbi:ATP-binding protein, partial [Salinispira pacifica]
MDLYEREPQWEQIAEVMRGAFGGQGSIALVSGEAGIGKTSFVTAVTDALPQPALLLWGGCDPLPPRPLGPVYDIAVRQLPELLDVLTSHADWLAVAASLHKTLIESTVPTVVVFEDVHWADEATLDLIKFLGRRVRKTATLIILTYREDEPGGEHPLSATVGDLPPQNSVRIRLGPLSENAVATMAGTLNRPASGIYEATRGNPFFVTEVLHSEEGDIPPTIRDSVLARMTRMPTAARELLEVASIIPGTAEVPLLNTMLTMEPSTLDTCIAAGFLVATGDLVSFRHELVRLTVEESLAPSRSRELHRSVIDALRGRPVGEVSLARLVHHASCASDPATVIEYGPQAGREASRHGAHRDAARYYEIVLRFGDALEVEQRARTLDELSFEYYLTGRPDEAIQSREEAVRLWRSAGRLLREGDGLRWLSRLYWFRGNKAMAERFAADAITILEPLAPGKELAMAYSNRSQLHMLDTHYDSAVAWGQRALELAENLEDTEITVHALTNIGTAEFIVGDANGRRRLEQALELAQKSDMHDHVARCYSNLSSMAIEWRDYPLAERYLREGLEYTSDRDMDSYSRYLLGFRARSRFEQGNWSDAAADAMKVLRDQGPSTVIVLPAMTTLAHLMARRGDEDAAAWLDKARDLAVETGELQRIGPVAVARAEAAFWQGRLEQMAAELEPASRIVPPHVNNYETGAMSYWASRAGGEVANMSQVHPVYGAMIRGSWLEAAHMWAEIGCPFEQALALSGGDSAAQRTALTMFEELGARPAARMLRKAMLARGERRLPGGARASTRANPEGLTTREMEVLT